MRFQLTGVNSCINTSSLSYGSTPYSFSQKTPEIVGYLWLKRTTYVPELFYHNGDVLPERVCIALFPRLTPCTAFSSQPPMISPLYLPQEPDHGVEISYPNVLKPIHKADHVPSRQGFTRSNTKSNQNLKAQYNGSQSPSLQQAPPMPTMPNSPSPSSNFSQEGVYQEQEPKKFMNEKYAKCSVKGNFLTLAAQPKNVELGEWLAHQCMHCSADHETNSDLFIQW